MIHITVNNIILEDFDHSKFDGSDALGWIFTIDQYFDFCQNSKEIMDWNRINPYDRNVYTVVSYVSVHETIQILESIEESD